MSDRRAGAALFVVLPVLVLSVLALACGATSASPGVVPDDSRDERGTTAESGTDMRSDVLDAATSVDVPIDESAPRVPDGAVVADGAVVPDGSSGADAGGACDALFPRGSASPCAVCITELRARGRCV